MGQVLRNVAASRGQAGYDLMVAIAGIAYRRSMVLICNGSLLRAILAAVPQKIRR